MKPTPEAQRALRALARLALAQEVLRLRDTALEAGEMGAARRAERLAKQLGARIDPVEPKQKVRKS